MIEPIARLGYASKALIYAIVGGLAISAALNRGGQVTDTSGALRVVLRQPFGKAMLFVLAAGLVGYAAWRILDAITDPDRHGTDMGGLITRIGNVVRGSIYGALGIEAFRLARGLGGSNGNEAVMWTARIMDYPFGNWLIGLVGLIVLAYGASQVWGAIKYKPDRAIDLTAIPAGLRSAATKISRFGVGSRGVIIATLGFFLVRSGIQHDPSEAHGTRESMIEVAGAVDGRALLLAIAVGLMAYAVDQALHARCRRIRAVI